MCPPAQFSASRKVTLPLHGICVHLLRLVAQLKFVVTGLSFTAGHVYRGPPICFNFRHAPLSLHGNLSISQNSDDWSFSVDACLQRRDHRDHDWPGLNAGGGVSLDRSLIRYCVRSMHPLRRYPPSISEMVSTNILGSNITMRTTALT